MSALTVRVLPIGPEHRADWVAMRTTLWPEESVERVWACQEPPLLSSPDVLNLIALDGEGTALGFAEAAVRHDYVNGCETSPVLFLEGLFTLPAARRRGVARALVAAITSWGGSRGITEFASDAPIDNRESHALHAALGFVETERVVYFRKAIA